MQKLGPQEIGTERRKDGLTAAGGGFRRPKNPSGAVGRRGSAAAGGPWRLCGGLVFVVKGRCLWK